MYTSCSSNKSLKNFTKVYVNNETTTDEGIIEKLVCERWLTISQDAVSVTIFFQSKKKLNDHKCKSHRIKDSRIIVKKEPIDHNGL